MGKEPPPCPIEFREPSRKRELNWMQVLAPPGRLLCSADELSTDTCMYLRLPYQVLLHFHVLHMAQHFCNLLRQISLFLQTLTSIQLSRSLNG